MVKETLNSLDEEFSIEEFEEAYILLGGTNCANKAAIYYCLDKKYVEKVKKGVYRKLKTFVLKEKEQDVKDNEIYTIYFPGTDNFYQRKASCKDPIFLDPELKGFINM